MATLPAISADSFGNRAVVGLPPLTRHPGTPADRQTQIRWREVQRRDPPGQATDDRYQQARSFSNAVYIAVRTKMTAMAGATAVVQVRTEKGVRKSQGASAAGAGESDWAPAPPDHPCVRLFEHVNPTDTFAEFLSEYALCRDLFGQAVVHWVPGRSGKPVELWNLRTNYLTATVGISEDYPCGAWRYYMPQPMLWSQTAGTVTIPRDRAVVHRHPHPLWPWDGYSPLTAGNKLVDFLNSIIDSRQHAMDTGLTPDAVIKIMGASEDAMRDFDARLRERFTGQQRGQRYIVVDGDKVEVAPLNIAPEKMVYGEGYDHGTAAVLALFGVPAEVAFLSGPGSYSQFYAAVRAFQEGTMRPEAKSIGDVLTKHLIRPHWGPDVRVEIKLPPVMDPELRERQHATLIQADAILVNELRADYDMPPIEGGDVTPAERSAEIQKASQPEQPGGMPGGGDDDILGQLLQGDPTAEPSAPGELDGPDAGAAGAGSLPGAVRKGVASTRVAAYFQRLVSEVCQ